VSGKGIPAALIMASFRASLIAEIRNNYSIRTVFAKVNKLLWESVEADRFVTAVYGVLDLTARRFTYVNAGHNPGLIYRAGTGKMDHLEATGPLLATFEAATYKERHTQIEPGDVLVLYSDGVTEAMSPEGELFGMERLEELVRVRAPEGAGAVLRGVREATRAFQEGRQFDDLTLVVVKGIGA
jgi:sigma-B regulation protein RsbU (phosphoserine phosphatase)